ncbi:toprim domain-containing protein [Pedobacter ghigonis]|uniref:toprim domain-containing protein n=1 Tax=Pedobacter ghigonis TaxID=2730403 RepID=UPI00158EBC37|nr:toprim domain-containing protein [Pedobacter ghigonis]
MEENRYDLNKIREETDLVTLLSKLGYQPLKRSAGELFYLSMLRDSDTMPSFCVNEKLGIWYDHGLAKGGNVIDFALSYWPALSFRESIGKLLEAYGNPDAIPLKAKPAQIEIPLKHPSYLVREVRELGGNPAISDYLAQRGISAVAGGFIKEVYYSIKKDNGDRKELFSAGWQNDLGGWEVRNRLFKGCLGKKSMSFISGDPDKLTVFEGMMDFLSWRIEYPENRASALILNSVSFLKPAIQKASEYAQVEIFFDHDPSGRKSSEEFLNKLSYSKDCSVIYQGYNDYNEMIQHRLKGAVKSDTDQNINLYRKTGR